jgi:hypothetical protein
MQQFSKQVFAAALFDLGHEPRRLWISRALWTSALKKAIA